MSQSQKGITGKDPFLHSNSLLALNPASSEVKGLTTCKFPEFHKEVPEGFGVSLLGEVLCLLLAHCCLAIPQVVSPPKYFVP